MLTDIILFLLSISVLLLWWNIVRLERELDVLHEQFSHMVDFMWDAYNKNKSHTS